MTVKVLVTSQWPAESMAQIRADFPEVNFVDGQTEAVAVREIVDADASFGHLTRAPFLAAKQLRWIQSESAGVEWMWDIPELPASDVIVTNMRGAHAATIAEHCFGMLLYMTRQFPELLRRQRERIWNWQVEPTPLGLSGKTLGILGMGHIGRAIAKRGKAFDMRVIGVDINEVEQPDYVDELYQLDGLAHMLREADAVAIAAPITPESRGMIGAAQLELMKPTAHLLVMSRGKIVDEQALIGALNEEMLAGAGLDVQAQEPMSADNPLWGAPRVILSPHNSAVSAQTFANGTAIFRENLRRFVAGEPLTNTVSKERGY